MSRTELPWLWRSRHIRPYALAISLVMLLLSWYILVVGDDSGTVFDNKTLPATIAGMAAFASFLLLWFGFWWQSGSAMKAGLLISAGVMMARAVLIYMTEGWGFQSVWFSALWFLASAGAYLLELTTAERDIAEPHGSAMAYRWGRGFGE